ncbi:MAG: hypothetical protein QXK88_00810 [Desulfurococcaceae archaeon]
MPSRMEKYSEKLEIMIGSFMLFTGWFVTFLAVIRVIPSNIPLLLLCYALSIMGLALSIHGVVSLISTSKRKK